MAVEARRGCGYRKVGGLYLVADGGGRPCCRFPIELHVCPTCAAGIKPSRGWTWIDLAPFIKSECKAPSGCPLATPPTDKIGLVWIGEGFYPTPEAFEVEAWAHGISRRIAKIPRGFVVGETWVALAHRRAVKAAEGYRAGIFRIFRPTAIELIVTATDFANAEEMDKLRARGITPVAVPDDDPDHRGSVHRTKVATLFDEAEASE